jgi:hypothetical protein
MVICRLGVIPCCLGNHRQLPSPAEIGRALCANHHGDQAGAAARAAATFEGSGIRPAVAPCLRCGSFGSHKRVWLRQRIEATTYGTSAACHPALLWWRHGRELAAMKAGPPPSGFATALHPIRTLHGSWGSLRKSR